MESIRKREKSEGRNKEIRNEGEEGGRVKEKEGTVFQVDGKYYFMTGCVFVMYTLEVEGEGRGE